MYLYTDHSGTILTMKHCINSLEPTPTLFLQSKKDNE